MSHPSPRARSIHSIIRAALPARSPTVVSICARPTRRGRAASVTMPPFCADPRTDWVRWTKTPPALGSRSCSARSRRAGPLGLLWLGHRLPAVLCVLQERLLPAPVGHAAVGAQLAGRGLAAACALAQVGRLVEAAGPDRRPPLLQEADQ